MPNERQYVAAEFNRGGRLYTYHNDEAPVAPGDKVKLPSARGKDGWQRGKVIEVHWNKPDFETKAILGLVPDEAEQADAGPQQGDFEGFA